MNRSQQVVEVYRELRRVLEGVSSGEMLACAASIVDSLSPTGETKYDARWGGTPFDDWSLDAALGDGGWRVLARESRACDYEPVEEDERLDRVTRELARRRWQ